MFAKFNKTKILTKPVNVPNQKRFVHLDKSQLQSFRSAIDSEKSTQVEYAMMKGVALAVFVPATFYVHPLFLAPTILFWPSQNLKNVQFLNELRLKLGEDSDSKSLETFITSSASPEEDVKIVLLDCLESIKS